MIVIGIVLVLIKVRSLFYLGKDDRKPCIQVILAWQGKPVFNLYLLGKDDREPCIQLY